MYQAEFDQELGRWVVISPAGLLLDAAILALDAAMTEETAKDVALHLNIIRDTRLKIEKDKRGGK